MRIALVACCGRKLTAAAPAKELYISPLFKKARAYCERHYPRWFILSAVHGLLSPEDIIAPYDVKLDGDSTTWAALVFHQLRLRKLQHHTFIAFAGRTYCDPLSGLVKIERPLAGLGIGQQLSFFTEKHHNHTT